MPIYFDNNATTYLHPQVMESMQPYLSGPYGNPSSLHRNGRASRDAIEAARADVASLVGADPSEVIWTSGGTEASNLAIKGVAMAARVPTRLLYGATEHAAVIEPVVAMRMAGWTVGAIPVGKDGLIDVEELKEYVSREPFLLVAMMLANNETGVVQDIASCSDAIHESGGLILVDAVQAAGKLPVDFDALRADLLFLSAHKFHGPRGAGALICRSGVEIAPLHHGGGQEHGLRGGTENVAAIVGFASAAKLAKEELQSRIAVMGELRYRLECGLLGLSGVHIFAESSPRLPNTVLFTMAGYEGEALVMALDRMGIAISSGSACHSGQGEPSHVLRAMGVEREVAMGAVRVSLSEENNAEEIDRFLKAISSLQIQA